MKIAVTNENGKVFEHFGHCQSFKIYNVEDNKVVSTDTLVPTVSHQELIDYLAKIGINVLISGGMGQNAQNRLAANGIKVYIGVEGTPDQVVNDLLSGKLNYNQDASCNHDFEN